MNVETEETTIDAQETSGIRSSSRWGLSGTLLLYSTACIPRFFGTSDPFTESDLVGVWQAKYENIRAYYSRSGQAVDVLGTETLTLRPDGTYTQVYDDQPRGNVRTVDGKSWYLDRNQHHTFGGRDVASAWSSELSAIFEEQRLGGVQTFNGRDLQLDAGEAYLWVNSLGDGVVEMFHLPTGRSG